VGGRRGKVLPRKGEEEKKKTGGCKGGEKSQDFVKEVFPILEEGRGEMAITCKKRKGGGGRGAENIL